MLFTVDCENDKFVGWAELADDYGSSRAVHCLASDQVLSLARPKVALLLDDLAGEQHAFHVKDGQAVLVHFLFRMKSRHIQASADSLSDAKEGAARHPEILRHLAREAGLERLEFHVKQGVLSLSRGFRSFRRSR
jgi:hypothetical protein